MVLNLTSEAYQNYKDRLFSLTFSERFWTVHYVLTKLEKKQWATKEDPLKNKPDIRIGVGTIEKHVTVPQNYLRIVQHIAQEFSYDSLTSPLACQDLTKATLRAHAALNRRSEVCIDDLVVVMQTQPFLKNPFSPYEGQIVRLSAKGLSTGEICKALHKGNYKGQVQKTIMKAKLRGILDE
jgi:hypothetical protein